MVQTLKSPESSTTTSNIGNDLNTLKIVKLTHQTDLKIMKMIRLDHLPYSEKKLNTGYTIKYPYLSTKLSNIADDQLHPKMFEPLTTLSKMLVTQQSNLF